MAASRWPSALHCALAALVALLAACSRDDGRSGDIPPLTFEAAETGIAYEIEIVGAPDEKSGELFEESLSLYRLQERGAQSPAFLRRRAEGDVDVALKILRSRGYYGASISTEVGPAPVKEGEEAAQEAATAENKDDDEAPAPGVSGPPPGAEVLLARLVIDPGKPFTLTRHDIIVIDQGDGAAVPVLPEAGKLGSPVGRQAGAAAILAAEGAAVSTLRNSGRPWATLKGRRAVADPPQATLEVETTVAAGPPATYGGIEFTGLETIEADYLRSYQTWKDGAPVSREQLREYQRELVRTSLFGAVSVTVPDDPPEGGPVTPVLVTVEEGKPRTVAAGVRFSSDTGPEAQASYVNRNLLGEGERFEARGLLGTEETSISLEVRKPQYLRPGQDLIGSIYARNRTNDAFDEQAITAVLRFERELDDRWTVGAGGLAEVTLVDDFPDEETVVLFGIPAFVRYDSSDNELDPKEGIRASFHTTPVHASGERDETPFIVLDGKGSTYFKLDDTGRYVLAARGRVASILADTLDDVPAPWRLYSGGGGSVRGYRERFIGPLDIFGNPIGGRSAVEAGTEMRAVLSGPIGAVAFVEAGTVSTKVWPDFDEGVQFAAGAGLRYLSPVGPIRFDVAFPLNPRDEDDAFQIYLSIGQAY